MKKIYGRVLVKESNAGIPNLVIAAYDSDRTTQGIASISSLNLRESMPESLGHLGKRIGSVLTNQDGVFAFSSDELDFSGNETRPDLLIVVFAPEDIRDVKRPYPLPPEQRILYISSIPRNDAGSEEAYIIRLLQAQLDEHQIPSNTSQRIDNKSETASLHLFNAIEQAYIFRDNLKVKLAPRMQVESDKAAEIRASAKEKFKNLSAIPKHLKNRKRLLKDPSHLERMQNEVIIKSCERFNEIQGKFRLTLSEDDLQTIGLKIDNGKITGRIEKDELKKKFEANRGVTDLIRVRDINIPSAEDLVNKYIAEHEK
ncbi:MAG: hypothetical protein PHW04_09735 [Candidatus Wallbacteria bacterium]|nr:hypothetical protein [Candidatus Wallbacteria bacterium]